MSRIRIRECSRGYRLSIACFPVGNSPGELYYKAASKYMGKRELLLIAAFVIAGSHRLSGHCAASRTRVNAASPPAHLHREHRRGDARQPRIGGRRDDESLRRLTRRSPILRVIAALSGEPRLPAKIGRNAINQSSGSTLTGVDDEAEAERLAKETN